MYCRHDGAISAGGSIGGVLDEGRAGVQKIGNGVCRAVLGAPGYAPVVTLRGKLEHQTCRQETLFNSISFIKK